MTRPRRWLTTRLVVALTALSWGANPGWATAGKDQMPQMTPKQMMDKKVKPAQRKAAAENKKKAGLTRLGAAASATSAGPTALAPVPAPGTTPDYFGPYSNWANSPLPSGPIASISVTKGGAGYTAPTVTITDVYGSAPVATTATVSGGGITGIAIPPGVFTAPVVNITDPTGTGAVAAATITPSPGTGLRKFLPTDTLPSLVVATPDTVTYPGTDYYEIELGEYTNWQFHGDLPATKLRGYRQTNFGTDSAGSNTVAPPAAFSYLGPTIIAVKGRPTRVKFTNNLPAGSPNGDLFIPTDTTVMGAGTGYDPGTASAGTYPQNRGTLHLHGGFTPWVSDGTPHQWVTPTGEPGPLTTGVSTQPVPDMPIPPGNSMTFYWPNQQSGRLMFYHDHAYGITRLNVYAGEAAGYLLVDPVERALTDGSTAGIPAIQDIPLVIQDKSFVWGSGPGSGTWATDPTWNWGAAPGSLWFPHVYMPNQNPWDTTGANAMGRWDYALWFWPPFTGLIQHGTVPNPYYDPINAPWEPPEIPGTPNPSLTPEAFMDTPVVNGKAYPTLSVPAGPVRFRILNAANDRFWNLSMFVAADKTGPTTAGSDPTGTLTRLCNGAVAVTNCTEVKMVPFNSSQDAITPFPSWWYTPGLNFVFDDRIGGVPDPTTRGPAMIQIGTEGGLLPAPAVIKNQPVNYTYNRRNIVVLNVQEKALFLGPAERADVIVDFSDFAGKTLVLYNDAPAPVPAADQRIDYFTGTPDQTDTGGAPPTLPGYGPNTRTIMQIVVGGSGGAGTPDYVNPTLLSALQTKLPAAFAASQDPVLVPQAAYNPAYGTSYTDRVGKNLSSIQANSLAFPPLFTSDTGPNVSVGMQSKAIQELFELDYGRMNATLGVELPFTNGGNQTTLPMGYIEPATEIIDTSGLPAPVKMDSLGSLADGTQIWKITHNGVDTHAIHVHLFNAQVVNRVGWDGAISKPDANELGWKETIRMNPLEDIIIALRPTTPQLPFGLPISVRMMSPADPPGTLINTFDPTTGNPTTVANALYDFGWEYVWHCHLLGHEENDMMRPTVFNVPATLPDAPSPATAGGGVVTWTDPTPIDYANLATAANLGNPKNEIGFRIARSVDGAAYTPVGTAPANATSFIDTSAPSTGICTYEIVAYNAAGDSTPATTPSAACSGLLAPIVSFTGAPPSAASGVSFTVTAVTNSGVLPTIASLGACSVGAVGGTPASATATVTMNSGTGTCNLTANWPASGTYLAATATQTTIATLAAPTVTFTGAPASAVYNSSFTVAATTNATTTAVITSSGACTNSGTTVTMISGTGTCNLTASWGADLNYASATRSQSTIASKAASSVATFTANPATSVVGQPVTFNFTVTGIPAAAVPTGTVTVSASTGETCNGTLAAGTGSCASTFVTTGGRTMTASYGGDANYSTSTATRAQAVGDFAMGVNPGSATVNGGQKATYTLTVTSLGGFTGPVALTCPTGLPAGFTCTIAPATVTPNGGAKNATVTVTTVKGARTLTLTVTGRYGTGTPATGGLTHTVSPTLTVRK